MREQPDWASLSVQDFINHCNWQGHPPKSLVENAFLESWQCLSVKEFFNQSNWQGQSLANNSHLTHSVSLTLPVSEFFQCIVWEGQLEIAARLQKRILPELPVAPSQDLKLTDLSDLF